MIFYKLILSLSSDKRFVQKEIKECLRFLEKEFRVKETKMVSMKTYKTGNSFAASFSISIKILTKFDKQKIKRIVGSKYTIDRLVQLSEEESENK